MEFCEIIYIRWWLCRELLKRKVDKFLIDWKNSPDKKLLIINMLVKQGYKLYFYKNEKGTIEMDFFIRDKDSLIPVEVKATDGATISLNNLITSEKYKDIKYGIKLGYKNIGFNGKFYTFPYFLTFLLKKIFERKIKVIYGKCKKSSNVIYEKCKNHWQTR